MITSGTRLESREETFPFPIKPKTLKSKVYRKIDDTIMTIKSKTSSSSSAVKSYLPCSACRLLRQKCKPECVFRPHFPGDQPKRLFENAHRVFTAGRIRKMLESASPEQRDDVAKSIIFESSIRVKSPVHGSYGLVLDLQDRVKLLSDQLRQYQTPNPPPLVAVSVAAADKPSVAASESIHITLNNNHYFTGVDGTTNSFFPGCNVPLGIPNQNANANANLDDNGNASGEQAFGVSSNGEDEMQFDELVGDDSTTTQLLSFLKKFGYKVESAGKSTTKDDDDEDHFMTY